jgi:hypothetical protein
MTDNILISKEALVRVSPYIVEKDITVEEFLDKEKWPSRIGKFKPGDRAKVSWRGPEDRFKAWVGRKVIIVGWKRSYGQTNQSEYRVFDPDTNESRWIYSDALKLLKDKSE